MVSLPSEIWERILRYLPLCDQLRVEGVCRNWLETLRRFWTNRNGISVDSDSTVAVLVDEICVSASSRHQTHLIGFLNCLLQRYGSRMKYIRLEKRSNLETSFLASIATKCPNLESVIFDNLMVMYRDSEASISLSPLVTLPTLKRLHLISNCAVQIEEVDWSRTRRWAVGTVCPVIPLFPLGLDSMSSGICELWLEDVMISSRTFLTLCHRLSQQLRRLCLKLDDCGLQKQALCRGLEQLTGLVDLNLCSKRPQTKSVGSLLDDGILERVTKGMWRLETLSLRGACHVTATGLNLSIFSANRQHGCCGLTTLKYLNLNRCPKVDYNLANGLRQRRPGVSPNLHVFAYLTDISDGWARRMSCDSCRVVIDPGLQDESVFFGEPKLTSAIAAPSFGRHDDEVDDEDISDDTVESDDDNDDSNRGASDNAHVVVNISVKR